MHKQMHEGIARDTFVLRRQVQGWPAGRMK